MSPLAKRGGALAIFLCIAVWAAETDTPKATLVAGVRNSDYGTPCVFARAVLATCNVASFIMSDCFKGFSTLL